MSRTHPVIALTVIGLRQATSTRHTTRESSGPMLVRREELEPSFPRNSFPTRLFKQGRIHGHHVYERALIRHAQTSFQLPGFLSYAPMPKRAIRRTMHCLNTTHVYSKWPVTPHALIRTLYYYLLPAFELKCNTVIENIP